MAQSEPLIDYPPPDDHQGADGDFSDAPMSDPGATDAVRFAGCSIDNELRLLEAQTQ